MLFHEYLQQDFSPGDVILKTHSTSFTALEVRSRQQLFVKLFKDAGVTKGDRIIILMENGFNAICLQLACSEIGAVFIPVNPFEPATRVQKIVSQYRPVAVLIEDESLKQAFNNCFPISYVEASLLLIDDYRQPVSIKDPEISEDDLLYIISTSGTTGNPKGIKMSHKATVCFFKAIVAHCKLSSTDNLGSISPLQFDFSLLDLGLAWGSDACLTILSQSLAYTPRKLINVLIETKVTQLDSVPAIWSILLRYTCNELKKLSDLKAILYAGDKFPVKNMLAILEELPEIKIINCFGQSESIACTFYDVLPDDMSLEGEVPIGNGYLGSVFYVVDQEGKLIAEENAIGELWLSNDSLFDGYWENEKLSQERLIDDCFNSANKNKVYKTGDLVLFKSGKFYFQGRKDTQVKVNGNRVELDEIEQVVSQLKGVADVAALAIQENETAVIKLFVSVLDEAVLEEEEVRKHCRLQLPIYMVPTHIYLMNSEFPLSANGKVDKSRLDMDCNTCYGELSPELSKN